MNAIMHRDYESNAPVQFYEYDDRIEVQNPGGLYGKVSLDNFPNISDCRNPYIAEAIKILGYVNRFSRGVYRVQKELIENGNGEASFDFSLITAFRVVENISARYFEEGYGSEGNKEDTTLKSSKKHLRNIQEDILQVIKNNPLVTRKELETLLSCSHGSIKHHISQLVQKGVIQHEGSTKAGKWIIKQQNI